MRDEFRRSLTRVVEDLRCLQFILKEEEKKAEATCRADTLSSQQAARFDARRVVEAPQRQQLQNLSATEMQALLNSRLSQTMTSK